MPATPVWLAAAEAVLNRSIQARSQALAATRRLEGKTLEIDVTGIMRLRAACHGGRLALTLNGPTTPGPTTPGPTTSGATTPDRTADEPTARDASAERPAADAVIAGSPAALLALLTGVAAPGSARTTAGAAVGAASAQVRGDAETASAYRDLLRAARPDLEEELARLVGDLPARQAGTLARGALDWAGRASRRFGENIAEYLTEESRDLVNKTELAEFLRGVDELREAADRIEARLRRLERLLPGPV
jgi:ubiquinone biosynthesis protein UbiJ